MVDTSVVTEFTQNQVFTSLTPGKAGMFMNKASAQPESKRKKKKYIFHNNGHKKKEKGEKCIFNVI